ncbi:MAG: phosphoheptose isomerase [Blastocatellia bacterium]|nr:MAG: phosphoheptose isomerase [Blastocatellia bacterium]
MTVNDKLKLIGHYYSTRIYANFRGPTHQRGTNSLKFVSLTSFEALQRSLDEHLETVQSLIRTKLSDIEATGEMICAALSNGHKILLCGNGGSAADAQHIAAELVGVYEERHRKSWPAIALTTDTSALTAISNDFGYEAVFERQVTGLAQRGDVLIALSTSGKSPNILRAVKKASELGCQTIGLTGGEGEPLASQCDLSLIVPASRTSRIQEAHITIGHLWCELVDLMVSQ